MRGARKRSAHGGDEIVNARHAAFQIHSMADLPARAGSALENKTKMKRAARLISTGPRDIGWDAALELCQGFAGASRGSWHGARRLT